MPLKRDFYLQKFINLKDKDIIKVITGIRRCGKSYLLFNIYYSWLINQGIKEDHILTVNLESMKNEHLRDAHKLYDFIFSQIKDTSKYYIFIDEVQLCSGFEDVVNGIKNDYNTDVYITGSNSKLLSSDINTKLRGRGMEIRIFPLSFKEYYEWAGGEKENAFKEYVLYGGLPFITHLDTEYEKKEYLETINSTLLTKDIVERNKIKNSTMFENVVNVLFSGIGSYVSANKIANTLKSSGFSKADNETVASYLKYLCDAFVFYKAVRFDLKGKKYLSTQNKYYACDLGLRNDKLGYRQTEMSHIMENIVYLELIRRSYSVDIGKNALSEIDFVARSHSEVIYIQVSYSIENSETKQRELNAFINLDDGWKKVLITHDDSPFKRFENGVINMSLFDFLLNENSLEQL